LPVFDKPMFYYGLSVLIEAGIQEIGIVVAPDDQPRFQACLLDPTEIGLSITYIPQKKPEGIASAIMLAHEFTNNRPITVALGDNVFINPAFGPLIKEAGQSVTANGGAHIVALRIPNPERFTVVEVGKQENVTRLEEKPINPKSPYGMVGLYVFDSQVHQKTTRLQRSERGEFEVADLVEEYRQSNQLTATISEEANIWFDAGTSQDLLEASIAVRQLQTSGAVFGSPELACLRNGFVSLETITTRTSTFPSSVYTQAIQRHLSTLTEY
jgi:glucose-1-phosphate thymidylyltransferase